MHILLWRVLLIYGFFTTFPFIHSGLFSQKHLMFSDISHILCPMIFIQDTQFFLFNKEAMNIFIKPVASVVVYACDPSSLKDEVGGPWIQGQPLLWYELHVVGLLLSVSAGPTVWTPTESFFPVDPIQEPKPQVFCNFYTYLAELLMMTVIEK